MSATVIKLPATVALVCSECGAEGHGSCGCGAAYVPKRERAIAAIKANPEKSDRAIAAELGASPTTVGKARQVSTSGHLEKRVGRDGKMYPSAGRVSQERVEEPEYPTEEEIWLANAFYHWSHCYENYRKLSPAAKAEFESNREPWSEK